MVIFMVSIFFIGVFGRLGVDYGGFIFAVLSFIGRAYAFDSGGGFFMLFRLWSLFSFRLGKISAGIARMYPLVLYFHA